MKILVVDDSRSTRQIIIKYIAALNLEYVLASSGAEALVAYQEQKPDLILLDVILPDITGFEVAKQIRALEQGGEWTPIIFLTSRANDADLERGIAAGGDDYLHKPVSQIVLGAKIHAMQRILAMRQSLEEANRELRRLTNIDGLTGVANRRSFDENLQVEWRRMGREGRELCLLMCDVDYFKKYNDAYGHLGGDDCLRRVASTLSACIDRGGDMVARYGGEEFAIILPNTPAGGGLIVGERARYAIRKMALPHEQSEFGQVTISIGVAALVPRMNQGPEVLIATADKALYEAKTQGRNRVVLHQS